MISKSDALMADHEIQSMGKDWLLITPYKFNPGFGIAPGVMLYTVVAGAYTLGIPVSSETLIKAGYRLEIV